VLALAALVYLKRPAPIVETVTTVARQPVPVATPIIFSPQLPEHDADVEQAGDRIAEVEVYLKKRQSVAALAALTRARHATTRALEARQRKGSRPDALASALRELDSVQRAIERGAYEDAHRQLVALDKNLDHLDF
jgi:ribosome-binding protein aMBF1 (putative translation factor)